MDALAERLNKKLREWNPETAEQARKQIDELMERIELDLVEDEYRVRDRNGHQIQEVRVEQYILDLL